MSRFLFYDDKIVNLFLKEEKPTGGAAVQAFNWIKGLQEQGQDIVIMTNTCRKEQLKEDFANWQLVPLYNRNKGVRWLRWVYYRFPFIYQQIKNAKPDYLYQGIPGWTSFVLGSICKSLGIKFVLRVSNDFLLDDRFYKRYGKVHRYFQWQGIRMSHCVLCQNDYQYNIIQKSFPGKNAYKISNPMSFNRSTAPAYAGSKNYIAWLGLFQYQKNLRLLFEIASLLPGEQFMVAGKEDSSCDDDTRVYLQKLKQLPNVSFVGFLARNEVLPFLAKAKYLLNTSHYEGFSNTFLEAMSVGTPILTSTNVNPDEIISEHALGIVYASAQDLAAKLTSIPAVNYNSMCTKVQEFVYEQHDYKLLAKRLLHYLHNN